VTAAAARRRPPPQELGWRRSDIVLSTKIFWGGQGPNDKGLSRKHIVEGTRASLSRLQVGAPGGAAAGAAQRPLCTHALRCWLPAAVAVVQMAPAGGVLAGVRWRAGGWSQHRTLGTSPSP
jgi:hypothetical protein